MNGLTNGTDRRGRGLVRVLAGLLCSGLLVVLAWNTFPAGEENGTTYVVELRDFFFDPPGLLLERGDRVVFVLVEDVLGDGHSATAFHPDLDKALRIPETAPPWNTGLLREFGASAERVFRALGVHDFFCIPHADMGMVGRIVVEEATGPGSQPLSVGVSPAGRSVMPTLDELFGPVGEVFGFIGRLHWVLRLWERPDQTTAMRAWERLASDPGTSLSQMWERLAASDQAHVRASFDDFGAALGEAGVASSAIRREAEGLKRLLERLAFALPPATS